MIHVSRNVVGDNLHIEFRGLNLRFSEKRLEYREADGHSDGGDNKSYRCRTDNNLVPDRFGKHMLFHETIPFCQIIKKGLSHYFLPLFYRQNQPLSNEYNCKKIQELRKIT